MTNHTARGRLLILVAVIFLMIVTLFFVLDGQFDLPEWLVGAVIFACSFLWFILWPLTGTSSGQKKSMPYSLVQILVLLVIMVIVAMGLARWLASAFDIRPNLAFTLVFGIAGLILFIGSLAVPRGPAITGEEKSRLVRSLIDKIKRI